MKKSKIIIAAVTALLLLSVFYHFATKSGYKRPDYQLYTIYPITIQKYITTSGVANPIHTLNVGTQVSGRFTNLHVWYNSIVKKGQLLAEIDPTAFLQKIERDKANLESAEANVSKQKAILSFSKLTYHRNKILWKENLIAHAKEQSAFSLYLQSAAQLKYAEGTVNAVKAQLAIDKTNLSYTKIYSPVNGIIININVVVGQTVASTFQTPSLFTIGENIAKMKIDTATNESDLADIKKGDAASFTVYAHPYKTIWGYVHNIRINPTTVSGVVSYDVTIYFSNKHRMVLPGMTAIAKIYILKKKSVTGVPNAALRFIPKNENKVILDNLSKNLKAGYGVIWILKNKEKPEPVIVKLGINNDSYTQVISKDIKTGTKVVVGLKDNSRTASSAGKRSFL